MYSSVLFNSVDLTGLTDVYINAIELYDQPIKSLTGYKLARQDGNKIVNTEYADKSLIVDGYISAVDRSTFETDRDTLLKNVKAQEAVLSFTQAGATRQYTCTLANIIWNEKPGGGFATFSLQFACSDPFGSDSTATTDLNASAITTSTSTKTITAIGGSYLSLPTFTITLTAVTGGTAKYMRITNPANSKALTITRTWANADVVVINCSTKIVTVNGVLTDYTGTFPTYDTTDTQVQYDDTFTTRTVALSMTHIKRYL